jgi:hypothetical protein
VTQVCVAAPADGAPKLRGESWTSSAVIVPDWKGRSVVCVPAASKNPTESVVANTRLPVALSAVVAAHARGALAIGVLVPLVGSKIQSPSVTFNRPTRSRPSDNQLGRQPGDRNGSRFDSRRQDVEPGERAGAREGDPTLAHLRWKVLRQAHGLGASSSRDLGRKLRTAAPAQRVFPGARNSSLTMRGVGPHEASPMRSILAIARMGV